MSKKMKIGAFDSCENARARFKHQTLLQDFMELQQETEAARNNLLALKQKKLTLQAEVRFLRRRRKLLLQNKSLSLQEQVFASTQPARLRKGKNDEVHIQMEKPLCNLPKKKPPQNIPSPEFDLILGNSLHGVKQQSVRRPIANRRVGVNGPKGSHLLDSREKDIFGCQEHGGRSQTRKPVIDLNQISMEEEELQDRREPFESQTHGLIRNAAGGSGLGSGSGSSGRLGKRKISWQNPVALTV